jgi:uncharacterized protein (TIGR01777 family)
VHDQLEVHDHAMDDWPARGGAVRRRARDADQGDHEIMRIVVTGSTGLIGTALVTSLHTAGHDVVRLVRRAPRGSDEVTWDPATGSVDLAGLAGVEAAVHLAGAGVGDHRWTDDYKRTIRDSRVDGTRALVDALTKLDPLPRVLVSGSAVGYYGSRGDEPLTESSTTGTGFLAEVVRAWEAAAAPAAEAGIRVCYARSGLVLAPHGGALGRLLPLAKLGLAGPLGNGRQWWPWITLEDEVRALQFLVEQDDLDGPVNLGSPHPARNIEVTRAIGRVLHRPTLLPAPAFGLRLVLGEFADDVLASQRMLPARLLEAGFGFHHQTVEQAAEWVVHQP